MSNYFCEVAYPTTTTGNENIETDLVYVYNQDKDSTNLVPYTTNIIENTVDVGTYFKNQYNTSPSLTTNYNTSINYVNLAPTKTWTTVTGVPTTNTWNSVSISSTGQYGIACINTGSIYYSSDYGHTWSISNATPGLTWSSVSISSTGQYGLGCAGGNPIYYLNG